MTTYAGFYLDDSGSQVPSSTVTVFQHGTNTPASLFTDRTKAVPAGNPLTTDDSGNFFFYAAPAQYDLVGTVGGAQTVVVDPDAGDVTPPVVLASDLSTYLGVTFTDGGARATAIIANATQLCLSVVDPLPAGAQSVVLDVAVRAYLNPGNVTQETTGPFGATYGSVSGGLWLTRQNEKTLRRLSGGGGAFTIDTMPATAGQDLPWWDTGVVDLGWSQDGAFL